jgi:hypothetical protein
MAMIEDMMSARKMRSELHHTEKEFLRIVEELKEQEKLDSKREGMIVSALRLHAEGNQQLNRQLGRLIRSTTILAVAQILMVLVSIVVGAYVAITF